MANSRTKNTKIEYKKDFPEIALDFDQSILIYDEYLEKKLKINWLRKFKYRLAVKAGESLKDTKNLSDNLLKIQKVIMKANNKLTFVSLGGGSISDFVGFVASVYHRGWPLIHIPSTWLAAIDSVHGGKTALNLGHVKNQIGSFYPAQRVIICRSLLMKQGEERALEASSEAIKICLIDSQLWKKYKNTNFTIEKLWRALPDLIDAKYRVVNIDPEEKQGFRQILNFGHTVGHLIEASAGRPHGTAVMYGLGFALGLSYRMHYLSETDYFEILSSPMLADLPSEPEIRAEIRDLRKAKVLLLQDKKRAGKNTLNFIFLEKPGSTLRVEMAIDDLFEALRRF